MYWYVVLYSRRQPAEHFAECAKEDRSPARGGKSLRVIGSSTVADATREIRKRER